MTDTIAAIATSAGVSAINIIKVSGKDSIEIVNNIFKGKDLTKVNTYTIHYGYIEYENKLIDEVLVSIFKSPKTYTGEDVVEINCHGGYATTNKILEILLTTGCRLAEPGEFIKRAFLNGKKNLMEVEAVEDIINAKTEKARMLGINGLSGKLTEMITSLKEKLLSIIANIEVNIDYPEYEDALLITNEILKTNIKEIKTELTKILEEGEKGKLIKDGIKVGIVGKPNVGKSSLLNKLLNEEKAIVTDIEGTTRDIVEGTIYISGIPLYLIDTAGIRETNNIVEKIGVEKSEKIIETADLILALFDGSKPLDKEDEEILKKIKNKKSIIIINKYDLEQKLELNIDKTRKVITCSVKDNIRIDNIYKEIENLFNLSELEGKDLTYLSNARQISLVKTCLNIINDIEKSNEESVPVDLIQIDLQNLWETLGEIIGETYKEELLDEIFSKFCLGK